MISPCENKTEEKKQYDISESYWEKLVEIINEENKSLMSLRDNLDYQYELLMEQKLSFYFKVLAKQKLLVRETKEKEEFRQNELKKYFPEAEKKFIKNIIVIAPPMYKKMLHESKTEFDENMKYIDMMRSRNQLMIQEQMVNLQNLAQKDKKTLEHLNKKTVRLNYSE